MNNRILNTVGSWLGVLVLVTMTLVPAAEPALAASNAAITVDAPAQALTGSSFAANITISNVTDLNAANYDVSFDPSVLSLDNVTDGNITLSSGVLSNNLAQEIPATWLGGSVQVGTIPGDANGDGVVNALDITEAERIIVHLDQPTLGADANGDGSINALDITWIERIIAGLN